MKSLNLLFIGALIIIFISACKMLSVFKNADNRENHLVLNLQPDGKEGKDAMIWTTGECPKYTPPYQQLNLGSDDRLLAHAWTNSGYEDTSRFLINFDLSIIPKNADIDSARLSLYNNNTTESFNGKHSGGNACYIQRITSNWDENTVTWETQPTILIINQISLEPTTYQNQHFENIDVTALVRDMHDAPDSSYGFLVKLQIEQTYKALVFASSDHENVELRPKLDVYYTVKD